MVWERSREIQKVMTTPRTMTPSKITADSPVERAPPAAPTKNMVMMEIRVGKRPLQGTKLLVMMAMSRSRGESMMRQPTIPAALQPKPMHMVRACLPQAQAFLNWWSRLKATRGR